MRAGTRLRAAAAAYQEILNHERYSEILVKLGNGIVDLRLLRAVNPNFITIIKYDPTFIDELKEYVTKYDDYMLLGTNNMPRTVRGEISYWRRLLDVPSLKLRKFFQSQPTTTIVVHLRSLKPDIFKNLSRNERMNYAQAFSDNIITPFVNSLPEPNAPNLNRANNANTRRNIRWKNVPLNSLNNKNESIGGHTFQVGNKAVKLWKNYYVTLRTLRGITQTNASNVYNMRGKKVIGKNPWTRNDILRKNIEFVKFV